MEKKELKCQKCGSPEIKKTLLGGSGKLVGIVFIVIGGLMILSNITTPKSMLVGLIFLLIGIASVATPKYKCKSCSKKFF